MKRNMKLIGLAACLISCTSLAVAQENPEPQERQQHEQRLPREVPNPEKIATQMTDQMQESLQLTEKQYKKIYKLNLKEQKEHFKAMQNSGKDEQVLALEPLELRAAPDPLVDIIFRHITGRMNVRWWQPQSGRYTRRTSSRRSSRCPDHRTRTWNTLLRLR